MQKTMDKNERAKTKEMRMDTVKRIRTIAERIDKCRKSSTYGYWSGEYYVDLGKRVRKERTSLKLSQEELGMLWGVTQAEVSNIELGNRKISVEQLFLLKMLEPSLDLNILMGSYLTESNRLYEELRLLTRNLSPECIISAAKLIEQIRNSGSGIY